jgi:hypothetical protein
MRVTMSEQSATPVVPSFDDESEEGGRKLAIICSKGNLDMAYPGLILANAALGEGWKRTCSSPSGASTSSTRRRWGT